MSLTTFYSAPPEDEGAYFRESVEITPEALNEEFARIPADMAYWGERYAEATQDALRSYAARKLAHAKAFLQVKHYAATTGTKITETEATSKVEVDSAYQAAVLAEVEAESAKLLAKTRFEAISAKRDMIISLGATQRAEMAPQHIRNVNGY